jgi:hypothetical protein
MIFLNQPLLFAHLEEQHDVYQPDRSKIALFYLYSHEDKNLTRIGYLIQASKDAIIRVSVSFILKVHIFLEGHTFFAKSLP